MRDCYFYDEKGGLAKPSHLYDELNYNNYEIYCLIHNAINYLDYPEKKLYAVNQDIFLKRIYIHMLLQAKGIKYIVLKTGNMTTRLLFYEKKLPIVILRQYISQYRKTLKIKDLEEYQYILYKINGIPENIIRGMFIRKYIIHPTKNIIYF